VETKRGRIAAIGNLSCVGCVILWIIAGLTLGAYCMHYSLDFWIGVDAPWYACVPLGAVTGGIPIAAGAITWACDLGGMDGPVWPLTDEARTRKSLPAEAEPN
jgi:hypothetical protein